MPSNRSGPHAGSRGPTRRNLAAAGPVTSRQEAAQPEAIRTRGTRRRRSGQALTIHEGSRHSEGPAAETGRAQNRSDASRRTLGLGPGVIACAYIFERLNTPFGDILAATTIIAALVTGAVLLTVILFGSTKSSDRAFRLLRWLRDKAEPATPVNDHPNGPGIAPSAQSAQRARL